MRVKVLLDCPDLPARLRSRRKAYGRSIQSVASAAGISYQYLSKLERGKLQTVSERVLQKIGTVLDCDFLRSFDHE